MKYKNLVLVLLMVLVVGCGKQQKIEYYCEQGELEDGKCKITESITPVEIKCEDDSFTYNEETKKCEYTISIPADRRLGCKDEENYTLKNGACYPNNGKGGVKYKINIYSCPDGATLNKDKCDLVDQVAPVVTCGEGYEANIENATCDKVVYEEALEKTE